MTTLAAGSSSTVAVRDGGTVTIATNGGMGVASITTTDGVTSAVSFGPAPERRVLGPYKEGAVVSLTNSSCGAFDYDAETTFDPASVAITGGTIGSVPIRTYLGVVASRGAVPSAFAAANKQTMSRSKHVAMDNIASLQLVMANFYLKSSNPNETTPGASAQYTASIEYPVGTLTSVTFSGSLTGTIADGSTMVSDAVAVSIPRGAAFYVRMWQSCSAGILYCGGAGLNNVNAGAPNSGEWFVFGATTPDLTQSTANSNNQQSGIHFRPTAIIGYTSRPSFMLAGDSRHGNGATYDASANGYGGVGEVERSLVKSFATLNAGCPGDTLANAAGTGWSKRLPLAQYCSHVICEYGINDFTAGTSLATMLANLSTFANKFGAKPFYQTTISPKSASTDSWATTANQTTDATANPLRVSFNNAVRQGLSAPVSGYIEVADQVESARDSGLWKVTGSANGYTADGLHGNSACNSLIEASAAFQNIAMD